MKKAFGPKNSGCNEKIKKLLENEEKQVLRLLEKIKIRVLQKERKENENFVEPKHLNVNPVLMMLYVEMVYKAWKNYSKTFNRKSLRINNLKTKLYNESFMERNSYSSTSNDKDEKNSNSNTFNSYSPRIEGNGFSNYCQFSRAIIAKEFFFNKFEKSKPKDNYRKSKTITPLVKKNSEKKDKIRFPMMRKRNSISKSLSLMNDKFFQYNFNLDKSPKKQLMQSSFEFNSNIMFTNNNSD